jgi:hypothetical protein
MTKNPFIADISANRFRSNKRRSALHRWSVLVFGIAAIFFFLFFLGPALERLPMVALVADVIDEKDIETGMYFYTDVSLFSEAQLNINNSMDFPPKQR